MMSNIEILEKIMADRCLSPLEFGRKIGKNDNFVSLIRSGRTKKFTAPVLRKLMEQFPEYSAEWLRTGEPPIYAAEVMSGNKAAFDTIAPPPAPRGLDESKEKDGAAIKAEPPETSEFDSV